MKTETIEKLLSLTLEEKELGIHLSENDEVLIGRKRTPESFTGEYKKWHSNGNKYQHYHITNGQIDGEYKYWHFNGQLGVYNQYKNGVIHGKRQVWTEDGILKENALYKEGKIVKDYLV